MHSVSQKRRKRESGHLLLAILLLMALMVIAATVEAPRIVQQMKRDREEEMIHRGTEYARAIKKFYKKFGRYPANLEQLDNTNNIRFIRQHYKDPLAKDGKWTLLHYGDIATVLNSGAPGTPAALMGTQGQQTPSANPQQSQSGFGTSSGGVGTSPFNSANQQVMTTGQSMPNLQSQGPQVQVQANQQQQQQGFTVGGTAVIGQGTPAGAQPGTQGSGGLGVNTGTTGTTGTSGTSGIASNFSAGGNQPFGGGAIVGVASVSKDPTIRVYNKKKTYNEWQFIYNPMMDQPNVLLKGPYSPTSIGGNTNIGTPAGQMNQQQSPFGQQNSSSSGQQGGSFGQQGGSNQPQQYQPMSPQFPPDQNH